MAYRCSGGLERQATKIPRIAHGRVVANDRPHHGAEERHAEQNGQVDEQQMVDFPLDRREFVGRQSRVECHFRLLTGVDGHSKDVSGILETGASQQ